MAPVTAIVVTYGAAPTLRLAVEALVRHSSRELGRIIVVVQPDIGGVIANVPAFGFPIDIVVLDDNIGFGPANNLAVAMCDTEYVAFVNPDLIVTEGWMTPLICALNDPAVAIAAPPFLDANGYLFEAGQAILSDGGTHALGGPHWLGEYHELMFSRDVDYVSAACWLIRRSTFNELGGFDPQFAPAYFEDSDLALTAWSRGLATRLVAERPVVHHHEGASADRVALAQHSRRLFESKWADHLKNQPSSNRLSESPRSVRDHRAMRKIVFMVEGDSDAAHVEDAATEAADLARNQPRDRITLVVPDSPNLMRLRRQHRAAGLEIITTKYWQGDDVEVEVRRVPT
ncbi:MAG: glycosyltransferase family 2 protein [Actinomycetota bacterium]